MPPMTFKAKWHFAQSAFMLFVCLAGLAMNLAAFIATGKPFLGWMVPLGLLGALGNAFCMGLWYAERE